MRTTARILPPTIVAIPRGRLRPAGGQGTAAATSLRGSATASSLRGATMEEVPGVSVQDSSGASGEGAMLTPSTVSHQFNLFLRRTTRSLTWEGGLPNKLPSVKHRKYVLADRYVTATCQQYVLVDQYVMVDL